MATRPASPVVDADAAKTFADEICRSELAVVHPPTATLVRTTNLTTQVFGTIDAVAGSPRIADLAGFTGQASLAGRGLLAVDTDGTLRGQWAGLNVAARTLIETGSVVENTVLGTGFGDVRAVGGILRGQGEPYPAVSVLRGDGRLEFYRTVTSGGALTLTNRRVLATGLTSATAVTNYRTNTSAGRQPTVLVLVADPGGLTQYVVDLEDAASAPTSRQVTTSVPAGIVGLGSGSCVDRIGEGAKPTGHGIVVGYTAAGTGHLYFGDWDAMTGHGSLAYVGTLSQPVTGGRLAP